MRGGWYQASIIYPYIFIGSKRSRLTGVCGSRYTSLTMISVPARRVKQFGVEFYQAALSAKDIDRLVKFEVLGYSGGPQNEPAKKSRMNRSRVNWDSLEKRIGESEAAYQRPVIRRKIDELVA